ncbi:MAG: MFS transporter [Candidatus Korobacteraceae bacterium]
MAETKPSSLLQGKRFWVVLFLFFNVVINYVDRVNLSIAAPVVAKHFHWDAAIMGWVFSAYLWTYVAFLVPSGWASDRFGARRIAAIAISIWSAAAMLTGAVWNLASMIIVRLGVGMGEATCFPMCNKVVRQWYPAEERGFATGIFHAGVFASIALTTPLVAWVVLHTGWRTSFVVFGSLGFIWLAFWLKWFHPPEECPWLPESERQYILQTRDGAATSATRSGVRRLSFAQSLKPLLRQKSMWGLFITQGCTNYMQYLFLAWLPSYLVQARGMNLMKAGIYTAIPYLVGGLVEITLGNISDRILTTERRGQGKRRNQVALFVMLTSVVLLISTVNSSFAIIAIITVVLSCNTTVLMFMYALTNDLIEDHRVAGTVFGMLLLGGNTFGLFAPIVTGYIVKATGRFDSAFAIAGVLALIGTVVILTMTRRPLHGPMEAGAAQPASGR